LRHAHPSGLGSHFDDRLPLDQGLVHSDSDGDYEERWAVVSAGSQARLPAWRTRPARPTPSEARFLQPAVPEATRVYPPTGTSPAATPTDVSSAASAAIAGGVLQMSAREFRVLYMATVPKDRVALLASIVTALDHQLGPQLVEVGLWGSLLRYVTAADSCRIVFILSSCSPIASLPGWPVASSQWLLGRSWPLRYKPGSSIHDKLTACCCHCCPCRIWGWTCWGPNMPPPGSHMRSCCSAWACECAGR
jgi:hypothetical protein